MDRRETPKSWECLPSFQPILEALRRGERVELTMKEDGRIEARTVYRKIIKTQ